MLIRFCKSVEAHTGTPKGLSPHYSAAVAVIAAGIDALVGWLQGASAPTEADIARLREAEDEFWPNAEPAARNWAGHVVTLSQFPARWEAAASVAGTGNPRELACRVEDCHRFASPPIGWCFPELVGAREVTTTRQDLVEALDLPAPCPPLFPRWACSVHNNRMTRFASDPRDQVPWNEIEQEYPWAWPLLGFLCEAARNDARLIAALLSGAESVVAALQGEEQQKAQAALEWARRDAPCLHLLCQQLEPIFGRRNSATEDLRVRALRDAAEPFFGPAGTGLCDPPAVFGPTPQTAAECYVLAGRHPDFRDGLVKIATEAICEADRKALREGRHTLGVWEIRHLSAESEAIVVASDSDRSLVAKMIAPRFRALEVTAHLQSLT